MKEIVEFELTKEYRDRFQEALDQHDAEFIRLSLQDVNTADITTLLYEFNSAESKYVLELLPMEVRAGIINDLDSDTRRSFLKSFTPQEITDVINQLDSDDVADILNELPIKTSEEVLAMLDPELQAKVIDLLRYEPNVAGGLMAKELIKARSNWSVVQCVEEIRKQAENVTKFYTIFVVDEKDKLLGKVALQDIVIADATKQVIDICEQDIVSVETYMPDTEVADIMKRYDLESVPVVNVHGQLVGRITIDDIVDVITEQAEEDRQLMSGITEDIEEDDTIWKNTRARLPWLLIGIFGGMISARFMGLFEAELARVTAIAFFVPLIQATGGNVGIQSSSLVVQSLAGSGVALDGFWPRMIKVLFVALLNGFFLSAIVFLANVLLFGSIDLSITVSSALFAVVVFASIVGTVTPLILDRFGVNPAIASGPFITTINDLLGLTVYFAMVRLLL